MSPLFLLTLCMALCINGEEYDFEAFIVGIFVYQSELDVNLEVIKPALELAVRKANQDYPRVKFNIIFRNGSTSCTANFAGVFAAEEYYLKKVTAFVGPACSLALDPVGRMAAYWNVPVFTAGGIDTKFADKTTFSTLTRLSLSLDSTGCFILQVLREFQWRHVAIIVDDSDLQSLLLKASIVHSLRKSHDTFFLVVKEFSSKDRDFNYTQILKESSTKARVFILLATGDTVRKILLDAYEMNMGNGEYTFLSIELIKNRRSSDLVWYKSGDDKNKESRKIFEALMIVAVRVPTSQEYKFFAEEVIKMSKTEFDTKLDATAVNPIVAAFYDCILMYAWALNRSLEEKHDPNDGFTLSRKLWNNTFLRGLTEPIYINENGDREADYTLNDLDPITGVMRPVATYFGAKKIYERIDEVAIHWPGRTQQPPPDVPECGFTGDAAHCLDEVPFPIFACIGSIFFILILVGILIGFHLYRKIKFESTLSDLWWRVRWEDIIFAERVGGGVKSLGSIVDDPNRRLAPSISNQSTLEESEIGRVTIGIYKGVQVAIETFNVGKLVVNRMLLLQMKQMRELTHENLVRFIGMCIEEPNIAIITEYSPRGSLQDIIHNGAMKIDWVFRYAMISDIVEGMVFLHSSVIGYHGRFKSTNCVIDGRFVVKITDYGMNSLYSQITNEDRIDPKKFFWTAPEHLRDMHPEKQGSKKGDVYSFAIILQEIITRTGPFERIVKKQNNLLPEDILEKVKMGTTPPFRPELSPEEATSEILDLMRKCWAEQPDDRPTFQEIKTQLKQITKGISSRNFLDNLLSRMEQYANNLEQLVEEKTLSLIDEKKKTDELLYQLLPKYIADELKKGNHIKPEAFESVTIFFSDIVGFTPLAAESTPIQVVDLLNDLYTCFDDIIDHYSAYKVETIGDAYMVVSGLPIRNGNEHAKEIALMSLSLLRAIRKFKVRHRNDRKLQVRIGIHSGPCAAGVVGLKMPRYCLFGDTVNTASRMESNGQAMKIHVSSDTKIILDIFGTFKLSLRGDIEIKGKGIMRTYWLEGETGDSQFGKE